MKINFFYFLFISVFLSLMSCNRPRHLIEYYPNGNIKSDVYILNKHFEGLCKFYYENGQLKREVFYKKSKVAGKSIEYYKNGNLSNKCNVENSIEKCVFYDSLERKKQSYEKIGDYTEAQFYYSNGQIEGEGSYYKDTLNGESRTYYPNGKIESLHRYKKGYLKGHIRYDSLTGDITDKVAYPVVSFSKDTFYLGEKVIVTFDITPSKAEGMQVIFGELDGKGNLVDTISSFRYLEAQIIDFEVNAEKLGLNKYTGIIREHYDITYVESGEKGKFDHYGAFCETYYVKDTVGMQ